MATTTLSTQEKKDLEKFTKFLAFKTVQIIIQSRSGNKINTKCKPFSSGTDWFNLAIQDIPGIASEAKKAQYSEIINSSSPLCIEISLRTIDGDTMVLEMWSLGVSSDQVDPSLRVTYAVYNRMGILLKSLISISRITPAYKLSRRQGPETYIICYRIFLGEPQLHVLGDNYKQIKIGQLCSPIGVINLVMWYRTKMTISPTQIGHEALMLKSDHFHFDFSPRHQRYYQNDNHSKSLSDTIKKGAFVTNKNIKINDDDYVVPDVPFVSLLTLKQTLISLPVICATSTTNEGTTNEDLSKASISKTKIGENKLEDSKQDNRTLVCNSQCESGKSSSSVTSVNDDFIMVDLKTPFAGTHTNSDLGTFYRECQSAPQLQAFIGEKTVEDQVGDLTKQLETFEIDMHHYENIICKLYKSDTDI